MDSMRSKYSQSPYDAARKAASDQGLILKDEDTDERAALYQLAQDQSLEIYEGILGARLIVGEEPTRDFGVESYLSHYNLENIDTRETASTGERARELVENIAQKHGPRDLDRVSEMLEEEPPVGGNEFRDSF